MKLLNNSPAIDFSVNDIYGHPIKLSNFKGKKMHIGFFRNVNCPFCNLRVHQLSKLKDAFESKNLKTIYFFESAPKILLKSIFHQEISPIPLVGDPSKVVYTTYGVEASVMKMMSTFLTPGTMRDMKAGNALRLPKEKDKDATQSLLPADFLIDEDFVIRRAHYGKNINDHIGIDEIKKFAGLPV